MLPGRSGRQGELSKCLRRRLLPKRLWSVMENSRRNMFFPLLRKDLADKRIGTKTTCGGRWNPPMIIFVNAFTLPILFDPFMRRRGSFPLLEKLENSPYLILKSGEMSKCIYPSMGSIDVAWIKGTFKNMLMRFLQKRSERKRILWLLPSIQSHPSIACSVKK